MKYLELLAPARNADIGIAAIDCGADAVYMAAEGFGARKDAANDMADVARLCSYAHRYGARIFLTVNTIIYDGELERAHSMMLEAQKAGVDAFIIQDTAITTWDDITVPLHASTQCAIRTPEKARWYESLGCSRLVIERETSLDQLRAIRGAVGCELEYFVHGALCVCYSGHCYMSEKIAGRSANRGECIQACRSLYDLVDEKGRVLAKDKALLSLKDYRLIGRLQELSDAGVCSFKIEGRLKNASYVKNVVREYSLALDALVAAHPDEYRRASFGKVSGGFAPDSDKTFNRGYTELYLDGQRGKWAAMNAPKSMGEYIGTVKDIRRADRTTLEILVAPAIKGLELHNGDGFAFAEGGKVTGFRGDVCDGLTIRTASSGRSGANGREPSSDLGGLHRGAKLYRNINAAFERELEKNMPRREIRVALDVRISGSYDITVTAESEDGRTVVSPFKCDSDTAENRDRQEALIREQLSKRVNHYLFSVRNLQVETTGSRLPLLSASTLNSIRRLVASDIDYFPCHFTPSDGPQDSSTDDTNCKQTCSTDGTTITHSDLGAYVPDVSYKANVANALARRVYASQLDSASQSSVSEADIEPAYELSHRRDAELMRTRYCIRYELGLCPVHQGAAQTGPLFLINNGRKFALGFDCAHCEMTVSEA